MKIRLGPFLFPVLLGAAVAFGAIHPPLLAQQSRQIADADPVLGTWNLNAAKSRYKPGPAPKSQTRTYQAHPKGVKATIQTVYADGRSSSTEYVANYDSVEYPVTGSPNSDAVVLKRIDAFTAEATLTHAGKTIGSARRVISEDGMTMTIRYQGMWEGRMSDNLAVYEKQKQ
ncbi:MAG: hypothetical protein HY646_14500 [Acidobacteria bacterium]|nr:hypothetical protein [Acidobacteriota bacterium]